MFKSVQKPDKIKFVALKFLYGIAAIPIEIRKEFMQKLLRCPVTGAKRKNAAKRKNIQLLKIIYYHLEENRMLEWNEERICHKLDISRSMFYCHKHYLLKGLRELYFGWEKIEKEEFTNAAGNMQSSKNDKNETELKFEKAEMMNEIGMIKEAKNEFLKIYRETAGPASGKAGHKQRVRQKILLLKLNKNLCEYYYHQKGRFKFNLHFIKAEKLWQELLRKKTVKQNSYLVSEIKILKNYCMIYKLNFNLKDENTYSKIVTLFKRIHSEAVRTNNPALQSRMLLDLGMASQGVNDYKETMKFFSEGERFTRHKGMTGENIVFRISANIINYESGKQDITETLAKVTELYEKLEGLKMKMVFQHTALFQCVYITSRSDRKDLLYKSLNAFNSHHIIINGYKASLRMLYFMKFSYYLDKISTLNLSAWNKTDRKPLSAPVRSELYKKLENTETELLLNFDKMYIIYFKMESYIFMLQAEFWKGKNMNFAKAADIIKKIEWLIKSRSKVLQVFKPRFEILKLCISLIEESNYRSSRELLEKYEQRFKQLSEMDIEKYGGDIVFAYAVFSYTAEQAGCARLKSIVKSLYLQLSIKYPRAFKNLVKKIEEKNEDAEISQTVLLSPLAA